MKSLSCKEICKTKYNEEKKLLFHGLHDGVTSLDCCSPDNGSSFGTRVSLCCHWTRHFVSLCFLTPHWMPGFDREKEVRPPAPGKKIPSRSEYQSERSSRDRKRKRKTQTRRTERRAKRQTTSKLSIVSSRCAAKMTQSAFKSLTQRF